MRVLGGLHTAFYLCDFSQQQRSPHVSLTACFRECVGRFRRFEVLRHEFYLL